MGKSQLLYQEAKKIIPGGTQLLSKRPEMFLPELWPAYYSRAQGCQVWDLDGNKFTDMSFMGIGSCVLGYADKDINMAVKAVVDKANMSTLNSPEEVELAKLLLQLHPWAQMARFARSGGEAMAIAVRIARAFSKKDVVLFCGYHGWHDWYLAANLSSKKALDGQHLPGLNPQGVPRGLSGTALPFNYNDTKGFLRLIRKFRNNAAAVVMEPVRNYYPENKFLQTIRKATRDLGIPLVVDEITAGFRLCVGGAHLRFGLLPDIAVFAKGISNGFPMAAIIGTRRVMEAAQDTFISSTYWTDGIGPAAALATIKKMKAKGVVKHLNQAGKRVQAGWIAAAKKHHLKISVSGIYPLSHFSFLYENPLVLKTLFTQLMLEQGFLATTAFYASYAHKAKDVERYLKAVNRAFRDIAGFIATGRPQKYLKSRVCQSGFIRLA